MSRNQFLSVSDIVDELNAGKGLIKYILRKFKDHIPSHTSNGQDLYPVRTLAVISDIVEKLNMGVPPSQIGKDLVNQEFNDIADESAGQQKDIRISHDGLTLLRSLIHDIGEQQKRIAIAHEKRAEAEERKAVAIEKRAEAEEKKAQAMNNIATALQEMNRLRVPMDSAAQQITHKAVQVVAADENSFEIPDVEPEVEDLLGEEFDDELSTLIEEDDFLKDDSELANFDDAGIDPEPDDLSLLIDSVPDPLLTETGSIDDLDSLIDLSLEDDVDLDDLSALLDDDTPLPAPSAELDDLYALIDESQQPVETDINEAPLVSAMDDLWKLIEPDDVQMSDQLVSPEMDDLSLLIEDEPTAGEMVEGGSNGIENEPAIDDLWDLIDDSRHPDNPEIDADSQGSLRMQMDDLSLLIDDDPLESLNEKTTEEVVGAEVRITIDANPEDVKNYKAQIMKAIIRLKDDGNTPEQTTRLLNQNNIRTISGKPEWSLKAVSQIYGFIDSATG